MVRKPRRLGRDAAAQERKGGLVKTMARLKQQRRGWRLCSVKTEPARLLRNRSGAIAQRKVVLVHRVVLVLEEIVNQPPTQSRDCLFYLIRHAAY
jgi:hypothetical protein